MKRKDKGNPKKVQKRKKADLGVNTAREKAIKEKEAIVTGGEER